MQCKDCIHSHICKFPNQEVCKGTKVSDLEIDNCVDFVSKLQFDVEKIRYAYWKRQPSKDPEAVCSNCGREVVYQIIDGKWAFENFCPHCGAEMKENCDNDTINNFLDLVDSSKTVNAEPIKHGRWIEDGDYQICSNCGEEHCWEDYRAPYCEACGAKMDGKGE